LRHSDHSERATAGSFHRFDLPAAGMTCGTGIASNGLVVGFGNGKSFTHTTPVLLRGRPFSVPSFTLPARIIIFHGITKTGRSEGSDLFNLKGGLTIFVGHGNTITAAPQFNDLSAITDGGTVLGLIVSSSKPPRWIDNVGVIQTRTGTQTILNDGTGATNPAGTGETA
jgi:hypothetical protein